MNSFRLDDNMMNTQRPPFRFEPPGSSSSDDSDCDDNNVGSGRCHLLAKIDDENNFDDKISKNDLNPFTQPSPKLAIIDHKQSNIKNKFSIWSEILLEQQLTETMDETLQIKDRRSAARRRKRMRLQQKAQEQQQQQQSNDDAENYFQWTQKDFEKKFGKKNSNEQKPKRIRKPGVVGEIAYKLKEARTDIIKNIVDVLGEQRARQLTAEVLDIVDVGGIMIENQQRKRSPGGTLFYLIKNDSTITDEQRKLIFGNREIRERNRQVKKLKHKRKQSVGGNKNNNSKNVVNKRKKNKKRKK
ncbi:hypothetical protein DERP_012921 [Dermatophagoides pteronyssinus]|uniref:Phosphorylated adapter RNA export protein n=1 Tax=Dermatophagoides pteronyssinus TaxID=6956 RepID=A0ABQ8J3V6_DERPT|nr:hypothetical protein DERP_012921 [Dermatophagoides pteronyssinus]